MPLNKDKRVRRVIMVEGIINILVVLVKGAVGMSTGSLAVLSDALHSMTDLANNVVAWFAVRVSAKPPDRDHPYGHRKFETLAVFVLAMLLAVLAVELALGAFEPREAPIQSDLGLWLLLLVLGINICLAVWESYWARRLSSPILHADALHTASDVLSSLAVITGWQLAVRGYPWLDQLSAFVVALLILWLAWDLFRRALPVLVDQVAVDPDVLAEVAAQVPGVVTVTRVRSRRTPVSDAADLTVCVAPDLSITESHDIADMVEQQVRREFGIGDIHVHVEPSQN